MVVVVVVVAIGVAIRVAIRFPTFLGAPSAVLDGLRVAAFAILRLSPE